MLRENWDTVRVFRGCVWALAAGGMSAPVRFGIPAVEIHACCTLQRIPRAQWARIHDGITHHMVPAFKEELSRK